MPRVALEPIENCAVAVRIDMPFVLHVQSGQDGVPRRGIVMMSRSDAALVEEEGLGCILEGYVSGST